MDTEPISLRLLVGQELMQSAPAEVGVFVDAIRQQYGTVVAAILFYGSCLRRYTLANEVADFYVLVDSYDATYTSPFLRSMNSFLPPNVFYLERKSGDQVLRAKYAVISTRDFAQATSSQCMHSIVWGRFCQPARLVYVRDEAAQRVVIEGVRQSVVTMVQRVVPLLPGSDETAPISLAELWQSGFHESYSMELRPELPGTIRALYETVPQRYHRIAHEALQELAQQRGWMWVRTDASHGYVTIPKVQLWQTRLSWRWRRPIAKGIYLLRLFKSAFTFGDWFPYVLWKIGRHRDLKLEATERQRQHPFIFGVPVLLKLLLRGDLR